MISLHRRATQLAQTMWRGRVTRTRVLAGLIALTTIGLLAPAAEAAFISSVAPKSGGPSAKIVVTFAKPVKDTKAYQYAIGLAGPENTACATGDDVTVWAQHTFRKFGASKKATLLAANFKHRRSWCPGTYHGTVNRFEHADDCFTDTDSGTVHYACPPGEDVDFEEIAYFTFTIKG